MFRRLLFILIAAVGGMNLLQAGIIYGNLNAAFPLDLTNIYSTVGPFTGTTFTATAGGTLASIVTVVGIDRTPAMTVTAGLYGSTSGEPGTLLESWTFTLPVQPGSVPAANLVETTLFSSVHPTLSAGTQYWFVVNSGVQNKQQVNWIANDQGILGGEWVGTSLTGMGQVVADIPSLGIQVLGSFFLAVRTRIL